MLSRKFFVLFYEQMERFDFVIVSYVDELVFQVSQIHVRGLFNNFFEVVSLARLVSISKELISDQSHLFVDCG